MGLTDRQKQLLLACVDAEIENSRQGDTTLSLRETSEIDAEADDDLFSDKLASLRKELEELCKLLRGTPD